MSFSLCSSEAMSIRDLALELFEADDVLSDDFRAELSCGNVSDDLLKETGCWDEAVAEMSEMAQG